MKISIPSFAKKPANVIIGILCIAVIAQHISASFATPAAAEVAPTDPAAIAIGTEIDAASKKYQAADKAIAEATVTKNNAAALAQAKRVELCVKFGMTYTPAVLGSHVASFQADANCPLQ